MSNGETKVQEEKIEEYFDIRSGLWYRVKWDNFLKCYIWTIAPHQQLIVDSTPK